MHTINVVYEIIGHYRYVTSMRLHMKSIKFLKMKGPPLNIIQF